MRAALPLVILCLFVQYPSLSTWAAVSRTQPQQQETSQPSPSAPATPVQAGSTASAHAQESTTAPGSNDLQDALPPAVQLEISTGDKAFDNSAYEVALDHFKKASKLAGDSCVECLAGEAKALSLMRNEKEALKAADKMDAQSRTDADRAKVHETLAAKNNCSRSLYLSAENSRENPRFLSTLENIHGARGQQDYDRQGNQGLQHHAQLGPS